MTTAIAHARVNGSIATPIDIRTPSTNTMTATRSPKPTPLPLSVRYNLRRPLRALNQALRQLHPDAVVITNQSRCGRLECLVVRDRWQGGPIQRHRQIQTMEAAIAAPELALVVQDLVRLEPVTFDELRVRFNRGVTKHDPYASFYPRIIAERYRRSRALRHAPPAAARCV